MTLWQQILINAALAVPTIPLLVAVIRLGKLSQPQKWLFYLLAYTVISNIASELISETGASNIWIFHIYVLVDFSLLTLVFKDILPPRLLLAAIGLFAGVVFFFLVWNRGWEGLPSVPLGIEALWMIFLVFWFMWKMFREMKVLRMERQFLFWVSTGNLLYFSGNLLLFIFSNYVIGQSVEVAIQIWMANIFLILLRNLFYTISLVWKDPVPI